MYFCGVKKGEEPRRADFFFREVHFSQVDVTARGRGSTFCKLFAVLSQTTLPGNWTRGGNRTHVVWKKGCAERIAPMCTLSQNGYGTTGSRRAAPYFRQEGAGPALVREMLHYDQNRVRNRVYTESFLMVPGWFESPESQLSNHPGTIRNGSVSSRLRTRFWLQGNWIILPPLH